MIGGSAAEMTDHDSDTGFQPPIVEVVASGTPLPVGRNGSCGQDRALCVGVMMTVGDSVMATVR